MEKTEKDFKELLKLLNKHKVKYCVIGAYAVAFYSVPRYTKDMDLLVDASGDNAKNIVEALNEFGFASLGLLVKDFTKIGQVIQLGFEPIRIDILTPPKDVDFCELWERKVKGKYGNVNVNFVGMKDLIMMKKKSGRKQDLADVEVLKKAQKSKR